MDFIASLNLSLLAHVLLAGANMLFKLLSGMAGIMARASLRVRRCGPRAATQCSVARRRLTDSEPTSLPACRGSRTAAAPQWEYHGIPPAATFSGDQSGSSKEFYQTKEIPISGARSAMPGAYRAQEVFYLTRILWTTKLEDNTTPSSDLNHAFPPEISIPYTRNCQSQVH